MNDLIDRYVWAVSERLPHDMREDVSDELRTTIADMAEARGADDEQATRDVLLELGDPADLASSYRGSPRYLIGPRYYRDWLRVLTAVSAVVLPIVLVVQLAVEFWEPGQAIVPGVLAGVGSMIEVAMHVAVWTTVAFVIVERTGVQPSEMYSGQKEWRPESLPAVPRKRQITGADTIVGVVMLLLLGLLVVGQHLRPLLTDADGEGVPVLNPDLWSLWIPLLFALVVVNVGIEVWKYREGVWTRPVVVGNAMVNVLWVAYFVAVVAAAEPVNPAFNARMDELGNAWNPDLVGTITIAISVVICVWDTVDSITKHRRLRSGSVR